jgi:hypothetical protein
MERRECFVRRKWVVYLAPKEERRPSFCHNKPFTAISRRKLPYGNYLSAELPT